MRARALRRWTSTSFGLLSMEGGDKDVRIREHSLRDLRYKTMVRTQSSQGCRRPPLESASNNRTFPRYRSRESISSNAFPKTAGNAERKCSEFRFSLWVLYVRSSMGIHAGEGKGSGRADTSVSTPEV